MFIFQKKFDVEVDGIVFHCHQLSKRNLLAAAQLVSDAQVQKWKEMGPEILKVLRSATPVAPQATGEQPAKPDPKVLAKARAEARYAEYDPFEVVQLALDGWSLPDKIGEHNIEEIVDALTEQQIDALHKRILDESLPPIEPEAQAEREGKDSALSTST